jgi:hypothetical protein
VREREREEHLLCLFYSPSRFAAGFELFTRKRLLLLVGASRHACTRFPATMLFKKCCPSHNLGALDVAQLGSRHVLVVIGAHKCSDFWATPYVNNQTRRGARARVHVPCESDCIRMLNRMLMMILSVMKMWSAIC